MKKIQYLFLMLFVLSINTFGQVGINTDEPNSNTALHISERMKSTNPDVNNKIKGIIIPRLTQAERDKLTYSDAPTNSTVRLGNADNSLMIFNTTENCYNFWNIEEGEWKSVCGNLGNAKFTFDCANVVLKGNYVKGKEVDGTNYIAISVGNVTKAGSYLITAASSPNNGYSFVAQGTFTTTGTQTVKLYAQGTPVTAQTNTFTLSSSGGSSQATCTVPVSVQPDIAGYALNCSSIEVNGTYLKGTTFTSSNNITVNVNVSSIGSYSISTGTVNGVSFSASGVFSTTGTQTITLAGNGIPTVNNDFTVTVTSNTISGNASCTATIPVVLPAMTYAIIGNGDYSWNSTQRTTALASSSNFGTNGKVKIAGLTKLWTATNARDAVTNLSSSTKPDIILYFAWGANTNTVLSSVLASYINQGGCLLFGSADNTSWAVQVLLNGIYGAGAPQASNNSSNQNDYLLKAIASDPIINGPFGNLSGKYWGEDNSGSVFVSNFPSTAVQLASANNPYSNRSINPDVSIIWYDDNKNFAYIGDSVASAWDTNTFNTGWASIYKQATSSPSSKLFGYWDSSTAGTVYVYNAALELNMVNWLLKKAAIAGINPH
ncbi:MAG: hypothetical protein MUW56_07390 [Chryseobacterium sp.]|uniref:hypothetical protein n=1 Tax=Chryseobacterium sp. TaxID=1871047 RepID=UPI0025C6EBF5|nr:hypothetical protein [Chryseobacterium sp.]MCJ7933449.1 hypothetical protein [Chryseobacterium sp.]